MNELQQETGQDNAEDNSIDSVNINSIYFNKKHSILTANLKTSAGPNNVMVPCKVDMGSDENIMPLHIYKELFPNKVSEQLAATKDSNIQLKCITKLQ